MVTAEWIKNLCLNFDEVTEHLHFKKKAYKFRNKIFATLDFEAQKVSLKLSDIDQSVFCDFKPEKICPANGAWGKQGWTIFEFQELNSEMIIDALTLAYQSISPKKK